MRKVPELVDALEVVAEGSSREARTVWRESTAVRVSVMLLSSTTLRASIDGLKSRKSYYFPANNDC